MLMHVDAVVDIRIRRCGTYCFGNCLSNRRGQFPWAGQGRPGRTLVSDLAEYDGCRPAAGDWANRRKAVGRPV